MRLIQRYLFRQLLAHTLVATAALTGVAVLTASLSALDVLVNDRQSVMIFVQITLLATPQIIGMILPLAVCIAGLIGLNRLHTEQEIVICFAGGMSRWRVAAPAIRLAAFITVAHLVINLWVQPLCFREMREVLEAVKADIATTMIRPGEFTHPSGGLTVFAQSMDETGDIRNLFIDKASSNGSSVTYMAAEARIAKRDGVPVMVLHNGSIQQFSKKGDLNVISFDENVQDLRPFLAIEGPLIYHTSDRYLHELFFPDLRKDWERANLKKLYSEGNQRLSTPLYDLAFMALALAAVLGGAFSRLGYGARIGAAAAFGVGIRVLGFVAGALSDGNVWANVLQYATPVTCFIVCMLIVLRQHPARGPKRAPLRLAAQGAAPAGSPA
jgi:lipopolysaccharide export system permease protein